MPKCECGAEGKFLKSGTSKFGKWNLYACTGECVQESGQYAGKAKTFFLNDGEDKPKKKVAKSVIQASQMAQLDRIEDELREIKNFLGMKHTAENDELNQKAKEAQEAPF